MSTSPLFQMGVRMTAGSMMATRTANGWISMASDSLTAASANLVAA